MDIKVPDDHVAKPEEVANAILKALFGNGLPTDKRYLAWAALIGALVKWRIQIEAGFKAQLEEAKTEARDQMMRADEALLRLASMQAEKT